MTFGRFKKNVWVSPDTYEDMFGVRWKLGPDGGDIGTVVNRVIRDHGAGTYRFPEVDTELVATAAKEMDQDAGRFRMFRLTYALFERAWSLRGMEELMVDMMVNPAAASALFQRITEFNLQVLEAVLPHDFEGVYIGDDWGTQQGLIMGPGLWRTYIKPGLARMFAAIRAKGKYVLLHSCGNIGEVLPDLLDIGLHAYNTVQPELYDFGWIKREYGRHLTFWGGISTQSFLPFAAPREVAESCTQAIRILGAGGGFILAPTHAVTPDIPVENVQAMVDAVRSFRWG
jgi:uroporphyrinogen decarboxylase